MTMGATGRKGRDVTRAEVLRVGNCSGFLGDRSSAAIELLDSGEIDVLTGDWLAELTMMILYKQRLRDPSRGYATTFIRQLETVLGTCLDRGIKIVSNAGGLNPEGCADAVEALAARLGLRASVGHVTGDDLIGRVDDLVQTDNLRELRTGETLSLDRRPIVANAYLGAWGIVSALNAGADVVVTGRVTDASVVVGPAAWAFQWAVDDWDELAGAVVAGHVIECGAQATGGNFSFFQEVPGLERVGFPIAVISRDGSSVITKPHGSGGSVTPETVTAQLLYEIQSRRYLNPDVTVRLDSVEVQDDGHDRVRIPPVTGEPPTSDLKVSLAIEGGFRNSMTIGIAGMAAQDKASVAERAVWELVPGGRDAFDDVSVELLGRPTEDPATFGESYALLRLAVSGTDAAVVGRGFSSAVIETGLASIPGFFTTSPPTPAVSFATYRPCLVPASLVSAEVSVGGSKESIPSTGALYGAELATLPEDDVIAVSDRAEATVMVPLGTLLGARSGDKGGDANLGLWARSDDAWHWMDAALSSELVASLIPGAQVDQISRHRLPRLRALNFVLAGFLGDGVSSGLRFDAQAKGLAEFVRSRHVAVPSRLIEPA